jgi:ABC-2 type transport system ATP-binding protein
MIRVIDLTRTYGDLTAVNQVSFEVSKGEIVGLLGHNGAGKTTIIKMLTGFLEPTDGSIEIDGLDISTEREAAGFSGQVQHLKFSRKVSAGVL